MLEIAVLLTTAAVLIELLLVYRVAWLLHAFQRSTMTGIVFSVWLSWLLGQVFGAAGMTVLVAAVASTVATAFVYRSGGLVALRRIEEKVKSRRLALMS